jgi:hypothetical protein
MNAVVEFTIHYESFRNVDLFHQGTYFLRTSVYTKSEGAISHALPLALFVPKLQQWSTKKKPKIAS